MMKHFGASVYINNRLLRYGTVTRYVHDMDLPIKTFFFVTDLRTETIFLVDDLPIYS